MPNKNYNKGVYKERKIVNEARDRGFIAFRSAGSHSPIDVVIVDKQARLIKFVQCKPNSISLNAKYKLLREQEDLNGDYLVEFDVE